MKGEDIWGSGLFPNVGIAVGGPGPILAMSARRAWVEGALTLRKLAEGTFSLKECAAVVLL